jgi:2-polyprenyl-3-methyl-5-hydroxy-6-metoxy-1,4-benzoquinol methylase
VRRPEPDPAWSDAARRSYEVDRVEIWNERPRSGHAYAYSRRLEATLAAVHDVTPPGGRVLDVAAAQGNVTLLLAEQGFDVTWNDLRSDLIDYVRAKHQNGRVTYAPGNVFDLDPASPFDTVVLAEVIEHVAHPDQLLVQAARLARPGGHVVLTTPNGAYFRNRLPKFTECPDPAMFESVQFRPDADGHIFLLTVHELRDLAAAAGLSVEAIQLFTNSLTNGHVKLEHLLRVLPPRLVTRLESWTSTTEPSPWNERWNVHMLATLRKLSS